MTAGTSKPRQSSLPQLSGRLLWLYRICWGVLGTGALLASSLAPFQPGAALPVVALRLAKSAVLLTVAIILFYRRQRDPVAALLALAFLTWIITSSFDLGTDAQFARFLDRCRFLLFALALLLFPDGRWQPAWTFPVAGFSAIVFGIGAGETFNLLPTHAYLPLAIACLLAAIGSLVARFRLATDYALKQQLKWVALGLVAGVGLILCARAGAAASRRIAAMPIVWEGMLQLGIITLAFGFLVSLLRYRLFDAESVISRSAAYAALTIALVATFGGTEALIQNIGQDYLGMNVGGVSGGMAAAVAAVMLNPLHERVTSWAESRFQPDLAQLKREMPQLLARLKRTASTERLCAVVLPAINAAIHASRSAIMVDGQIAGSCGISRTRARRWARSFAGDFGQPIRDDRDLVFPLRLALGNSASVAFAWLVVGPRPDGTLYGREDLDAVRSVLPAILDGLIVAKAHEALNVSINLREEQLRTEIDCISARLQKLERALG